MDLQDKCVLLIGGSGFLGSHIVEQLLNTPVREVVVFGSLRQADLNLPIHDSRLRLVNGSIIDIKAVQSAMKNADGVFLLASLWLRECIENPRAALDVNVNGAFNVLEACKRSDIKRLVYASSSVVYGEQTSSQITESSALNNTTMYGATKIAAEQMTRAFNTMYQIPAVICRYTNVYGVRQANKGNATSVIVRFLQRIADNQAPVVFGDGKQAFDFISVKDAARATILAMQSDIKYDIFNIASGSNITIDELARLLIQLSNTNLELEYQPSSNTNTIDYTFSTAHAFERLGFRAEIPLEEGLREMVDWYLQLGDK